MLFYICETTRDDYCLISEAGFRRLARRDPIRCVRHGCFVGGEIRAETRTEARRILDAEAARAEAKFLAGRPLYR